MEAIIHLSDRFGSQLICLAINLVFRDSAHNDWCVASNCWREMHDELGISLLDVDVVILYTRQPLKGRRFLSA